MDPVTHFLSGAVLARTRFNRRAAYATLAMTLAAETPDIDVLWYLRGPVAGFQHHRGITHTFLGAPFEAAAVVAVVWVIHRILMATGRARPTLPPARWGLLWFFCLLAVLLHILMDFTNNYGVRPLFPFSPAWHAWSTVFIVDPWLLLLLSLALIIPALLALADSEISRTRYAFRGGNWAIGALVLVGLYYGLRGVEQGHAIRLAEVNHVGVLAANGSTEPVTRIAAEPYPLNPFHWHIVVETPDYYQLADVSTLPDLVTTSERNDRVPKPPVTPAVAAAKQSWLGRVYLGWSMLPVTRDLGHELPPDAQDPSLPQTLNRVEFEDLRFAYSAIPGSNEGNPPLSASAYVAPDGQVEAMYFGSKLQK